MNCFLLFVVIVQEELSALDQDCCRHHIHSIHRWRFAERFSHFCELARFGMIIKASQMPLEVLRDENFCQLRHQVVMFLTDVIELRDAVDGSKEACEAPGCEFGLRELRQQHKKRRQESFAAGIVAVFEFSPNGFERMFDQSQNRFDGVVLERLNRNSDLEDPRRESIALNQELNFAGFRHHPVEDF